MELTNICKCLVLVIIYTNLSIMIPNDKKTGSTDKAFEAIGNYHNYVKNTCTVLVTKQVLLSFRDSFIQ